jgi:amino acid transporter
VQARSARKLTLIPLIATTYSIVAGGPFGLEDMVSSSGYAGAIAILLLTAAFWAMPAALMVSEMASAVPEEGGYYAWVRRALGPFWGFQEGWLSLVGSIFDMAIYPTLFVGYLGQFSPSMTANGRGTWIGVGLIAAAALWNMLGAKMVGKISLVITIALLAPFAVLIGFAFTHRNAGGGSAAIPLHRVDLLGGVLLAMWNFMGWDNPTTVAGEVERPQRTYPIMIAAAVSLVAITYVAPIAAVWMTGLDPNKWSTGGWANIGRALGGGEWLAIAITIGGMLGAVDTLNALTMAFSRVPAVMAEDGFLPKIFAKVSDRTGAPWVSIIACATAWAACLGLSFSKLIMLDVLLTGLSILLEFAALIALRIREPGLKRPFRVPGGLAGAIVISIPPTALLALTVIRNQAEPVGPINALQLGAILIAGGVLMYFVAARRRRLT